ncbi:MAG: DNA cytosine methyltransferase [Vampirovibrionia bacterium]
MNVLSLFDGMSCGQIALQKLGIKVDKYFACEIDKYAIQVTQNNFPDTIQLGDVQFVTKETLGNHKIDLILGGSPCQGFSFAGKNLNFQDPRSALFFEFVRLVKELKPKYFLLENVRMKKESRDIISEYMGCEPIEINSALMSAQNRRRLYWTNIPGVTQPKDKGIVLKDIILSGSECDMVVKGFPNQPSTGVRVSKPINPNSTNVGEIKRGDEIELNDNQKKKIDKINPSLDKANCLTEAIGRGGSSSEFLTSVKKKTMIIDEEIKAGAFRARSFDKDGKRVGWKETKPSQNLELRKDEKSNSLSSVQKDNVLAKDKLYWRKLTPIECERLQTVPDNYTDCVSNTQRYKMLGNGWTVDVVAHIFKGINIS